MRQHNANCDCMMCENCMERTIDHHDNDGGYADAHQSFYSQQPYVTAERAFCKTTKERNIKARKSRYYNDVLTHLKTRFFFPSKCFLYYTALA